MDEITDQLWISDIDTVRADPISSAVDVVVSTCQDEVSHWDTINFGYAVISTT